LRLCYNGIPFDLAPPLDDTRLVFISLYILACILNLDVLKIIFKFINQICQNWSF
jgi:hypothetical protein